MMRQYPYGAYRVMVFAAPACWLCLGAGLPAAFHAAGRLRWIGPIGLAALMAYPLALACYRAVVPWNRAETGPAAAYVLARIRPDEPVIGNAWEDAYYFRHRRVKYISCGHLQANAFERAWFVATTANDDHREELLQHIQAHGPWRILDVKEFTRVTVYHLEQQSAQRHAGP
jgi:hypothetical protein